MQVPDQVRKCVAFVCVRGKDGLALKGTCFFVAVKSREIGYVFGYAVTAKHVIVGVQQDSVDGKVLLRINMKQGPSQFVETNIGNWKFHPSDVSVDVAVHPMWLSQDQVDFLPIPIEMAATESVIKAQAIGIGDEVFLTGLFVNHVGRERNLPIVRTGNIALMPEEPVQTEQLGPIEAYLVEARSIGGLSGSPVFVYTGSMRTIDGGTVMGGSSRFYWLGLMHGHWRAEVPGRDAIGQDSFEQEYVNMGIAIVVPVSRILDVINQEVFVKARQQTIDEKQRATLPTADTVNAPLTKEAFEETLKKVSAHGDVRAMTRFLNQLSGDPNLRFLQLVGGGESATAWLTLRQPVRLRELLSRMESVSQVRVRHAVGPAGPEHTCDVVLEGREAVAAAAR